MASIINATTSSGVAVSGDTSGVLQLATNNGTTAVTIDTSQNVGIGTTSPGTKFQVTNAALTGTTVGSNRVGIFSTSGTGKDVNITFSNLVDDSVSIGGLGGVLYFLKNSTETMRITSAGNVGIGTTAPTVASGYGVLSLGGSTGGLASFQVAGTDTGYVFANATEFAFKGTTAGPATFYTNNTERMRLDSSGNLLVGGTGNVARISVNAGLSTYNGIGVQNTDAQSGTQWFAIWRNSAGAAAGNIAHTGTTTVAYNTSSDYRLKENIAPMTNALVTVAQLKPVTYTWKADGSDGQGFIAHELQAVVPDCVTGEKDAVEIYIDENGNEQTRIVSQGVDTSFLVATLTAAIQEQQALITTLQTQVAALTAKVGV